MSLNDADTNNDNDLVNDFIDTDIDENHEEETEILFGEEDSEGAQSSQDDEGNDQESSTIKDIRKQLRETQRELNRLKNTPNQTAPEEIIVVGDKPTLESCEYDHDKFEKDLDAYYERKSKAEKQTERNASKQNELITRFNNEAKALGVKDFDQAKAKFANDFTLEQKNAILTAADNMALIVYALAKQPNKVEMLQGITDPIKLAAAIAKIEKDIKVIKKSKDEITPDKPLKGNASTSANPSGNVQKQLEKLREQAKKTGNMNAVRDFKRQHNIK